MDEEKVYCSMYSRNAELYHHGIKGQKWGVRNGPPYPLGSGKESFKYSKKKYENDISEAAQFILNKEKKYHDEYFESDIYKKIIDQREKTLSEDTKKKIDKLLKDKDNAEKKWENELIKLNEIEDKKGASSNEYQKALDKYFKAEEQYYDVRDAIDNLRGDKYHELTKQISIEREKYIYDKLTNDKEVQKMKEKADKARKILHNK